MKLLLDVREEKADFFLELLKNFNFVEVKERTSNYELEVLAGIKQAVEEMKLVRQVS